MGEKKDIDRLFQEKFKDFEKSPGPEMWTRIEQELNKDKKKINLHICGKEILSESGDSIDVKIK